MYDDEPYRGRADYLYPGEPAEFTDSMSLEERLLRRERRHRRRRAKSIRNILVAASVALLVLGAGIAAGYLWGRYRSSTSSAGQGVLAKPGGSPAPSSVPAAPAGSPGSRGAGGPAGQKAFYSWVKFRPPEHNEKAFVKTGPRVAIVVDDTGNTTEPLAKWQAIDAPLTFSVMPYPPLSRQLAWQLYQSGYVIMIHVPTENSPPRSFSGKGQLSVDMSEQKVFSTLDQDLEAVPLATGMNNHQGGLGCNDLGLMTSMCRWAKARGMYVVDSSSSDRDKVTAAALAVGLPRRKNQVFIDHDNNPDYIRNAMRQLAGLARQNGTAIGICHWHRPNTPTVVGEMIRSLQAQGINFVFARDITN